MTSDQTAWAYVRDQKAVGVLLEHAGGFHDAITTSASWHGAEFINIQGQLELHGWGELSLRIESQILPARPIELFFEGVSRFHYDYERDTVEIQASSSAVTAQVLAWQVEAQALRYRELTRS